MVTLSQTAYMVTISLSDHIFFKKVLTGVLKCVTMFMEYVYAPRCRSVRYCSGCSRGGWLGHLAWNLFRAGLGVSPGLVVEARGVRQPRSLARLAGTSSWRGEAESFPGSVLSLKSQALPCERGRRAEQKPWRSCMFI